MSEVDALERDVEAARARLVNRVAQLKAPPISGVKDELVADATEYKDEVIDRLQPSTMAPTLRSSRSRSPSPMDTSG